MKRFIFLDIDGVLNSDDFFDRTHEISMKEDWSYNRRMIDPIAVKRLNTLKEFDVQIIISSSWGYNSSTLTALRELGLKLEVIGGTKHYHKDWIWRGNEIAEWLCEFEKNNIDTSYEYVILDDDQDMLPTQLNNFVNTDRYIGFSDSDLIKVRSILKID